MTVTVIEAGLVKPGPAAARRGSVTVCRRLGLGPSSAAAQARRARPGAVHVLESESGNPSHQALGVRTLSESAHRVTPPGRVGPGWLAAAGRHRDLLVTVTVKRRHVSAVTYLMIMINL